MGNSGKVKMRCDDIATVDLKGGRFKAYTELAGVHKIALPLPPIDSTEFGDAITFPERNFNFSLSLYCMPGDQEEVYDELSEELLSTLRDLGHKKANLIRSRGGPELYSERVVSRSAMDFVVFPARRGPPVGCHGLTSPRPRGSRKVVREALHHLRDISLLPPGPPAHQHRRRLQGPGTARPVLRLGDDPGRRRC